MELQPQAGLTVAELIDLLSQHPGDSVVEMAIVAPVKPGDDDITVDRYSIDGLMPWPNDDESDDADGDNDGDGGINVWLVGGDDEDVDTFLDAIEQDAS